MRYSTRIVIFLVFLNAAAAALVASGAAADMGIAPNPGGDQALAEANQSVAQVSPGGGPVDTLFGLYSSVADTLSNVFGAVFAGPAMIAALGVPTWITAFVFAPMYLLVGIDIIYILTQRRP